jgi:hypothetical protein
MLHSNHHNGRSAENTSDLRQGLPQITGDVVLCYDPAVAGGAIDLRRRLEGTGDRIVEIDVSTTALSEAVSSFVNAPVQGVVCLALSGYPNTLLSDFDGAGPMVLAAALRSGAPLVVAPGGLDCFVFGSRSTLPVQYTRRLQHESPDGKTLVRTSVVESARLGRELAAQINGASGPVAVCLPLRGLSTLDAPGQPLYQMDANMALFGNLTTHLRHEIRIYDCNVNINDPAFARLCQETLEVLMRTDAGR